MTFTEIFNAIKSYLAGFLTFVVCFAVASAFLWNEYKAVQADKEAVSTKLLSLKDAQIKLEKEKSLLQFELKDAELKLEKEKATLQSKLKEKEFELSSKEAKLESTKAELEDEINKLKGSLSSKQSITSDSIKAKESELKILIDQYQSKVKEVNELYSYYSKEALKAKAEELILKAMNEFSALGVNIRKPDWCDKDYTNRYYQGEALIDQISALNRKYSISDEYDWYVRTNSRGIVSSSDGVCEANKSSNSDAASSTGF